MIAKKVLITGEKVLQTSSPMHQNIKNRKSARPDSADTNLYFSLLRTSLKVRHTPLSCWEKYASRRNRSEIQAVTTDFLG